MILASFKTVQLDARSLCPHPNLANLFECWREIQAPLYLPHLPGSFGFFLLRRLYGPIINNRPVIPLQ